MIYQVKARLCDGSESKQIFYEADAACGVYALRLGDMLMKNKIAGAPGSDSTHGAHIEEVHLTDLHYGRNADEDNLVHISSGRFPCEKEEKVSA